MFDGVLDLFSPGLNRLLDTFLDEDLGRGDLTSIASSNYSGNANLIAKQSGVFCGGPLIERLFQRLDGNMTPEIQIISTIGAEFT